MNAMLRNPIFYYVVVPLCVALWPLSVWTQQLPEARREVKMWTQRKADAEGLMLEILRRDPQRLEQQGDDPNAVAFSYAGAVDRVARLCGIRTQQYDVITRARVGGTGGKPATQSASVGLDDVTIEQTAGFLWRMQSLWSGLTCIRIEQTHQKGARDVWDVDLEFKYEF